MNRARIAVGLAAVGLIATACSTAPSATVPSIGGASAAVSHGSQSQELHAAAQCIRDHGIPRYQDPVVAPDGSVYTDLRAVQDAQRNSDQIARQVRAACQSVFQAANFNPAAEPHATPALVQAGVRAAQCLRAHGLPNYRDPTAATPFTPGHGFGVQGDELPAGGKTSGTVQQALSACGQLLDAEIQASSLQALGHG